MPALARLLVLGAALSGSAQTHAAGIIGRLLMFESDDCAYCAAWEHDVGGIYPLTDESRRLRLERISIDEQGSMQGLNKPIRFTPTFIVMFKGHEIGRIEGYRSEDAFWGLLGRLIDELDK